MSRASTDGGNTWDEETILRCLIERGAWSWTEGITLDDLLDCFLRGQGAWPKQTTTRGVWPSALQHALTRGYLALRQKEQGEQRVVITELGLRQARAYHLHP